MDSSAAAAADVIILGATGFTGRRVLSEFLRVASSGSGAWKIGIAGRNRGKLLETLAWAAARARFQGAAAADGSSVPIFEADVQDRPSLLDLCSKTRLLISCVGPYRLCGEPVVAACVESGVDYLDVTGEPEFMERMQSKYHNRALETGSLVVSACGFDSVPAELGLIFHTRQWKSPSQPNSVDAYLTLNSSTRMRGNFTTFESAVLGISSSADLQKLRKSMPRLAKLQYPGSPVKRPAVHWEEAVSAWGVKIPSSDAILVRRTLSTVAENPNGLPTDAGDDPSYVKRWSEMKPVLFGVYLTMKPIWSVAFLLLMAGMFYVMASFQWGRKLLLEYPEVFSGGVFSKSGPSQEEIDSASFTMVFVGRGYKDASKVPPGKKQETDKEVVTRVTGPEIGYATTPIILVQSAVLVLEDRKSLPRGGVWTPGAAFGTTDLQDRLQRNGMSFEVLSSK